MATKPAAGQGEAPDAAATVEDDADPRTAFYAERAAAYVEQVEAEIVAIETKIEGMKATLTAKRAELKDARKAV